jgi:CBS domain-containing protein
MPVAKPDGETVGIITEADIIRVLLEGKKLETLTAKDVMSTKPITVDVETPVEDVMRVRYPLLKPASYRRLIHKSR